MKIFTTFGTSGSEHVISVSHHFAFPNRADHSWLTSPFWRIKPTPPIKFFQIFEKTIYSKGLKLSVAVHSCSTEVLICHSCVYHFCCCHSNSKFHVDFAKNQLFWHNSVLFSSFLHQIVGICEFGHFISILTWFCVNFRYLWTFYENSEIRDGGSKMAGQITSFEVMTSQPTNMVSFCRASFGLSDQCKFISLCLNRRKTQGGFHSPRPRAKIRRLTQDLQTKLDFLSLLP